MVLPPAYFRLGRLCRAIRRRAANGAASHYVEILQDSKHVMTTRSLLPPTSAASVLLSQAGRADDGLQLTAEVVKLNLRHTWTTTMSSSDYRETLHVALNSGGITGRG